ncbi:hypothetical protein CDAR_34841 [Caerostris darwini]|uniref:Uncharacterized protein n=1 Tax=Caerostris darwini TaxID=1538125 RepID=A0AAV4SE06_9ARAC|nr:hypothetical protein CDAR_529721 [Caerostris darwini]GIY74213.1 hypothetical protein CDAR_34841 [Caerostris darwini]
MGRHCTYTHTTCKTLTISRPSSNRDHHLNDSKLHISTNPRLPLVLRHKKPVDNPRFTFIFGSLFSSFGGVLSMMPDIAPILPALVPLATLLYVFGSEYLVPISTDKVDSEYDYIVGE